MDIMNCVNAEFFRMFCQVAAMISFLSMVGSAVALYGKWVQNKGEMGWQLVAMFSSAAVLTFAAAGSSSSQMFLTLAKCVA